MIRPAHQSCIYIRPINTSPHFARDVRYGIDARRQPDDYYDWVEVSGGVIDFSDIFGGQIGKSERIEQSIEAKSKKLNTPFIDEALS